MELEKRPTTFAEKFRNICLGLGALTALILGAWANLRGEPTAEKTYTVLREQVNRQADAINRLHQRVVWLQAHEEGRTSASLQQQLDNLRTVYTQKLATCALKLARPADADRKNVDAALAEAKAQLDQRMKELKERKVGVGGGAKEPLIKHMPKLPKDIKDAKGE